MSASGVLAGPTVLGTLSGAPCAPASPQQPFPPPLTHAPCVQLILSSSPSPSTRGTGHAPLPRPVVAVRCLASGPVAVLPPCIVFRVQHDAVAAAAIPVRALAALPPLAPPPLRRQFPAAPSCCGLRPANTSRGPHGLHGVA